jgi:hypothetical protein
MGHLTSFTAYWKVYCNWEEAPKPPLAPNCLQIVCQQIISKHSPELAPVFSPLLMGMEGTTPTQEQQQLEQAAALQQEQAAAAASTQQGETDSFLLDAQIAEGLNNIDVIRYSSKFRPNLLHACRMCTRNLLCLFMQGVRTRQAVYWGLGKLRRPQSRYTPLVML